MSCCGFISLISKKNRSILVPKKRVYRSAHSVWRHVPHNEVYASCWGICPVLGYMSHIGVPFQYWDILCVRSSGMYPKLSCTPWARHQIAIPSVSIGNDDTIRVPRWEPRSPDHSSDRSEWRHWTWHAGLMGRWFSWVSKLHCSPTTHQQFA